MLNLPFPPPLLHAADVFTVLGVRGAPVPLQLGYTEAVFTWDLSSRGSGRHVPVPSVCSWAGRGHPGEAGRKHTCLLPPLPGIWAEPSPYTVQLEWPGASLALRTTPTPAVAGREGDFPERGGERKEES